MRPAGFFGTLAKPYPSSTRPMAVGTEDSLLGGRVKIWQPADGYRIAIDTVLLAAAAQVQPGERVLELGSGVGGAALCLAHRVAGCKVTGLEVAPDLVAAARRNGSANGMTDRVRFLEGGLGVLPEEVAAGAFDHVMANPPFLEPTRGRAPPSPTRAAAFVEDDGATLVDWLGTMIALTRRKGRITLIHRADRLDHVVAALSARVGDLLVYPLWPKAGRPAKRVIVTGRVGTRGPSTLAAGLVLHGSDGGYTDAADMVLRQGRGLIPTD